MFSLFSATPIAQAQSTPHHVTSAPHIPSQSRAQPRTASRRCRPNPHGFSQSSTFPLRPEANNGNPKNSQSIRAGS